ncbi:MAG: hypothetical protein JXP37_02245 [Coriobacteriia bacterium]|nr:hypothetical protein [Coriobacteriia bacterium]
MRTLQIIGAESLGVRGLCCLVMTRDRRIVIDPGVSLGYVRHGLLPHPLQIAAGRAVRARIVDELASATDVVVSHFHGDHIPLAAANPYQLALEDLPERPPSQRWWSVSGVGSPVDAQERLDNLLRVLDGNLRIADGTTEGPLEFSEPVPHGLPANRLGSVMMTRVECGDDVFVHASDIQLLDGTAVDRVLALRPSIVLAAGPPLYLPGLGEAERELAFDNAVRLARAVETVILDHHLMRSTEGERWLDEVSAEAGARVLCAADYMGQPRQLLEARRVELYQAMPVPPGWHTRYALGEESVKPYVDRARAAGYEDGGGWREAC